MKKLILFIFILTISGMNTNNLYAQVAETINDVNIVEKQNVMHLPVMNSIKGNTIDTTGALWNNGPLVTHPDSGIGGADESRTQTSLGLTTYGFTFSLSTGFRIADDFTATSIWKIDSIIYFGYQTNSTIIPTINWATILIWDMSPDLGGNIIFGNAGTNYLSDTSWSGIYRIPGETGGSIARPIMKIVCDLSDSNLILEPGTYWLDMLAGGSLASGPYMPPISIWNQTTTGNALQYSGSWANLVSGSYQQGAPFIIYGKKLTLIDMTVKSWLYPLDDIELSSTTPITVQVQNTGDTAISQFQLSYSIDSGLTYITPETVNHTLQPGETYTYTFTTRANLSAYKKHYCSAKIILAEDMIAGNDSLLKSFYNYKKISTFPYIEDFEAEHDWYHGMISGSDSWELGEPEGAIIDTVPPSGGLNVWMTDLDANYPNNEESYVISPAFDLRSLDNAYINMSVNYYQDDMTALQYSLDKGKSWKTFGATNSQGYNWYNVNNGDNDYWSGDAGDWQTTTHSLKTLVGKNNVLFRVWFKSDDAGTYDGFAFDNFMIFEPANDLELAEWVYPTKGCDLSATDSIMVKVINTGTIAKDTFMLIYSVDGGSTEVSELVIHHIAAGGEYIHTFATKADLSGAGTNNCYAYLAMNNDEIEFNNRISFTLTKAPASNTFSQNFESYLTGNGWSLEAQSKNAWSWNSGNTPTNYTGPSTSHGGSGYMFTPAYLGYPELTTSFYSPCLDFSTNDYGSLNFWSHMYGADMGEMHVDLLRPSGWENDALVFEGQQQISGNEAWQENALLLPNDVEQIRIRSIAGSGLLSDMAVDDINISGADSLDAGVVSIDPPVYEVLPTNPLLPKATVKNFGGTDQTFKVFISSGSYLDSATVSLAALVSEQVTFSEFMPVDGLSQTLTVWTVLPDDSYTDNNSISIVYDAYDTLTKAYSYIAYNPYDAYEGPCFFYLQRPDKMFRISPSQAAMQFVAAGSWAEGNWIGAEYYGNWVSFDTLTGERTVLMNLGADYMGLAYDWTTSKMYGLDVNGNLYAVGLTDGTATYIGNSSISGGTMINLACDSAGNLFTVDIVNDSLYQIDKTTAASKSIMHIGFDASFAQDMEYDHYNHTMYMAAFNVSTWRGELRVVDFDNDTTFLVDAFENDAEITALAIPYKMHGQTNIVGYGLPGETQPAFIDMTNHTVDAYITNYADITSQIATFILSDGATATVSGVEQVSGVTVNDFTNPVTYVVSNGGNTQDWIVTVHQTLAKILTYSIPEQTQPAEIDDTTRIIEVVVAPETDRDSLVASFTLSPGAIAKVNGIIQTSGVTPNSFIEWVTYWVINGSDSLDWSIHLKKADMTGTDFITYSFAQETGPAEIDKDEHTIDIEVAPSANLSNLTANFILSYGAQAMIGPAFQESGVTSNDFNDEVIYTVFSGMGDVKDWFVNVTRVLYTGNSIVAFKMPYQVGSEDIDEGSSSVDIDVESGVDVSNMRPDNISLSPGANISPSASQSRDFSSGPVTYTVTSESGSSRSWHVDVNVLVKVEAISDVSGILVYPIPASHLLNIESQSNTIEQVRMIDMVGKTVMILPNSSHQQSLKINVRTLQPGLYFLEVVTPTGTSLKRVEIIK
ncbi:MAG: T9SS type A sorting domain-containing protein [Bacteroidales bacterium]|nr:T9SS type A sorting domain-containing protein [Bacteroidales bacterium]